MGGRNVVGPLDDGSANMTGGYMHVCDGIAPALPDSWPCAAGVQVALMLGEAYIIGELETLPDFGDEGDPGACGHQATNTETLPDYNNSSKQIHIIWPYNIIWTIFNTVWQKNCTAPRQIEYSAYHLE
eukprot:360877-Chlamydomonas_euryale.AAC.3